MPLMIFFNQSQNVVNVDFYLFYQLHFKHNIIVHIFAVAFVSVAKLVVKIDIHAVIILNVPLGQPFIPGKLIKS